jgi:hypothetical protein
LTDGVSASGPPYTEITIAVADIARGELRGGIIGASFSWPVNMSQVFVCGQESPAG